MVNTNDENKETEEQLEDQTKNNNYVSLPKSKIVLARKLLTTIKESSDQLQQILSSFLSPEEEERISIGQSVDENFITAEDAENEGGKIIEGVFDGENMIGPDGKVYSVPANYASKSKLVEGDIMKLTITDKGTFIYKQIGPIERIRVVGKMEKNSEGNFFVIANGRKWRVLTASVTYFKGSIGDEVVILIPKTGESKWSAIENIVHN